MAEERPITPPLRTAVSEFHTPSPTVTFFTELVNRDDPAYTQNAPLKRGTLYSTIIGANPVVSAQYPNLYFLRERKFQLSDQMVFWDWSTDQEAEDTYNAEITYVANEVLYPAFTRVYTIRRDVYEAAPTLAIGSTLTALLGVTIEDGGQNYTYATGTITGKGVEIRFVVSEGQIISGVVTKEGTGVLSTDTIVINGDGDDAIVIPIVQPSTCYLTSQKKQELGQDDPLGNEFVRVIRTYETLPGPFLGSTRFDKDGALITTNVRRNITADITDSDEVADGVWTQTWHKAVDGFVSEETVETRPVPGNEITSTKIEEDGVVQHTVRQLVETSTVVSSETLVGGVWIRQYGTEVDDSSLVKVHQASNKVSWQVTETRDIPGNPMPSTRLDEDSVEVDVVTTLKDTNAIVTEETLAGGVWTKTTKKAVSDLVAQEIVETRAIPGNAVESTEFERDGVKKTVSTQLVDASTVVTDETLTTNLLTRKYGKSVSDFVSQQITEEITVFSDSLLDLPELTTSIKNLIPDIFLGQIPLFTNSHIVKGAPEQPALELGEFEHTEKALTPLYKEVRTTVLSDIDIPIVITGIKETNDKKQVVSITMTLEADTTTPTTPNEVRDVDFKKLGNGLAIEIVRTIPDVFPEDSYTKSILNLIPEKFRAFIPLLETSIDLVGQPSTDPTLLTGEFSRTEGRLTEFTKRVRVTSLAPITLPVIITGSKETNDKKQVVSVTYTLEDESTTPTTPNEVRDVEFQKLGNGMAVETVRTIPEVFPEDSYTKSILNLIPEKFRAAIPMLETSIDSVGQPSTDPTLLAGEFSRTEGRLTEFTKRVRVTSLGDVSLPVIITGNKETDRNKQVVSITYTLEDEATTPTTPTEVRDVEFVKLGNGMAVETVRTVPEVFPEDSYTKSILNLIPEKFRAFIPLLETTIDSAGSPSTDPILLTGEFSRTEGRLTEFTKRVRVTSLGDVTLPVVITGSKETDKNKQVVSVVYTLEADSTTPTTPNEVRDVEFQNLGNGLAVETVRTVPEVFPEDSYTKSIENLIPAKLRAAVPITESTIDEAGSPSTDPTLLTGELSRTEGRLTEFTKRTRIVSLGTISPPVTTTDHGITSQFGGADTTTTYTLDVHSSMTLDEGLMVLDSKINDLGNGYDVKISEIADGVSWTANSATHVDPKYLIEIGISRRTVDAGTAGGSSGGGNVITEVRSHDKWKSIQIVSTLDTGSLPADTQWFGSMRYSFPPELIDADLEYAEATCGCSDSFSAVLIANMNQYSGTVKTRVTEQFYNGVPPDDVTIDQFFPQTHHFGFAWASACGSTDGDCRTKSGAPEFHIPLCLHDDITLSIGIVASWTFPATTPSALPHGSYVMISPHVERWRFGVFRRILIEVLVP